jgi:hypothetical protein
MGSDLIRTCLFCELDLKILTSRENDEIRVPYNECLYFVERRADEQPTLSAIVTKSEFMRKSIATSVSKTKRFDAEANKARSMGYNN